MLMPGFSGMAGGSGAGVVTLELAPLAPMFGVTVSVLVMLVLTLFRVVDSGTIYWFWFLKLFWICLNTEKR